MRIRTTLLATTIALTGLVAAPATAAPGPVLVTLGQDGQGQHVQSVRLQPDGAAAGDDITVEVDGGSDVVRTTQPDPSGNGVGFAVADLGWVPAVDGVRLGAKVEPDGAELSLVLPPHDIEFGDALVARGLAIPGSDVRVAFDTPAGPATRETTADQQGRWSVDATTGDAALPPRWQFGTRVTATVVGQVDGVAVTVTMSQSIGRADVLLQDGDDVVTVTHDRAADVTLFGRRSVVGAVREDRGPLHPGEVVTVDGVEVPLEADTPLAVTDVDLERARVSGRGAPGAELRVDVRTVADNFTGSESGLSAVVDDTGAWAVSFSPPPASGPYTGAEVTATDPTPAADGASYGVVRAFGQAPTPADSRAGTSSQGDDLAGSTAGRSAARAALDRLTRRVHLDAPASVSVGDIPGEGTSFVFTATTDDGSTHVAAVDAVVIFGISAQAGEDDFVPPLDLTTGFDLEVDRGGTVSTARLEPFDLVWDPATTGFRGRVGAGQEVTLTADVPGWSDTDAQTATATAGADGRVDVALDIDAPGASAIVRTGDELGGISTEGGFLGERPLVVPLGSAGGEVAIGTGLWSRIAAGGPDTTTAELLRGSTDVLATGEAVAVRADGDRRRVPAAPTDVAVTLDSGPAIVVGAPIDVQVTTRTPSRVSTTRIPVEPVLCLDPAQLPSACRAPLPVPYMVVADVPITGEFTLVPRDTTPLAVERAEGGDRVGTSVAISRSVFPIASFFGIRLVDTVIVTDSSNFPDALAAAPLASAVRAPVLLNPRDALDQQVADEIARLAPTRVYLMGGEAALSSAVAEAITQLGVADVVRLDGADRFATAALAADAAIGAWRAGGDAEAGDGVLVALGTHPVDPNRAWPDALAAGPLSAYARRPILLTTQDGVPEATATAIEELDPASVTVIGGELAIPGTTADELAAGRTLERIGGGDRYHTSTLLADAAWTFAGTRSTVWAATGTAFPDGLASSAGAAVNGEMLVLTPPSDITSAPQLVDWLDDRRADTTTLRIAGGELAVAASAADQLRDRLE